MYISSGRYFEENPLINAWMSIGETKIISLHGKDVGLTFVKISPNREHMIYSNSRYPNANPMQIRTWETEMFVTGGHNPLNYWKNYPVLDTL